MYPAAYDEVLSVASVNELNNRSTFSTYNDGVDISAPGERIATNLPGGSFAYMSGTSFSAPIVAGAAAMVRANLPSISPVQLTELLTTTSTDLGAPGKDPYYGAGVLNMERVATVLDKKTMESRIIHPTSIQFYQNNIELTLGNPATRSAAILKANVLPESVSSLQQQ